MKKITVLLMAFLLCVSALGSAVFAEGETPAKEEEKKYATSEDYRTMSFAELFDAGKIAAPEEASGVKIAKSSDGKGIVISGTAEAIAAYPVRIKGSSEDGRMNFDEAPVSRVTLDGLSKKKTKASADLILDDAAEPLASFALKSQVKDDDWTRYGARTIGVYEKKLTGAHDAALRLSFPGLAPDKKTEVFLKTIEFAESSFPVMYFNIDEELGTVAEMNGDTKHKAECYGSVDISIPDDYKAEFSDKALTSMKGLELDYVRGRGNSTWELPKKPYKVKFEKKQDLFGMGKNKHWILLANRYDNSLIRNRMTYWLTRALAKDTGVFAPECVPVDVVMNGDYYGSYLLTEQIRVDKERVNIDDLNDEPALSDPEDQKITGGYLLSKEGEAVENRNVDTTRGVPFFIENPDFEEHTEEAALAQSEYIKNYLQSVEEAIFGQGFKDASGKGYADYLDIPAAVDYWWIQEFSQNGDAYGNGSTYLYKTRDVTAADGTVTPGKLYWGPLWDFDYVAWGDLDYEGAPTEAIDTTSDAWMKRMTGDPVFVDALKARWPRLKELLEEIIKEGGVLDRYADETRISEQYDNAKWYWYTEEERQTGQVDWEGAGWEGGPRSYDLEIEQLRNWIKARLGFVDKEETLDGILATSFDLTFTADGKELETRTYFEDDLYGELPAAPQKKGYTFIGWFDVFGDKITEDGTAFDGAAPKARYIKMSKIKKPEKIYFANPVSYTQLESSEIEEEDQDEESGATYTPSYTVLPENAIGTISWSSSDTSVADVDEDGVVTMHKAGTVKISAKVPSGKTYSYTLNILGEEDFLNQYETVKLDKKSIKVKTGAYAQVLAITGPKPCTDGEFKWYTTDAGIVTVDENGVITGKNPGTAHVILYEADSEKIYTCKVTVTATKAWKIKRAKAALTSVKARALKGGKIRLTWKKVSGVSGYYVYQASRRNGKYKKIAAVKKAKTTKLTKKIKNGKKRYFKVRPFTKIGKKIYLGKWSAAAKA